MTDLTIPDSGSTTTRDLLSTYLRAQYRLLTRLPLGEVLGDVGDCMKRRVVDLAASEPGPLFSVLRRPTIGGLVQFIGTEAGSPDDLRTWSAELIAQLSFELWLHGCLDDAIRLQSVPNRLLSLTQEVAVTIPSHVTEIEFGRDVLTLISGAETRTISKADRQDDLWERPFHSLDAGIVFSLMDNNPRSDVEAHPEKPGNAVDLGEHSVEAWQTAIREALSLIQEHLPEIYGEIELVIQQVIPVGYDDERHMSASFQEVVGTVYMSLHPDPMTLAEAIVHEFSHNKLNMLCTLAPVMENAFSPLYPSPLRPDLRPLHGVLLAVHAFLPVERLYEKMALSDHPLSRSPRFEKRRQAIRTINHAGAETVLEHGRPMGQGAGLFEEIAHWDAYFAALRSD